MNRIEEKFVYLISRSKYKNTNNRYQIQELQEQKLLLELILFK